MSEQDKIDSITDEMIADAFNNTNFGRTDYRNILLEGVKKTAIGYHNGWTLTQIIRKLGLGKADTDNENNMLTESGLRFIEHAAILESSKRISALEGEVAELKEKLQHAEMAAEAEAKFADEFNLKIKELKANNHDLREALESCKSALVEVYNDESVPKDLRQIADESHCISKQALLATPAESLQAHDEVKS